MGSAIELADISAGYDSREILANLSLTVKQGEFLGIFGPNGSGKSTLLRVMCGLLPAWEGTVYLESRSLSEYSRRQIARRIAFLPQQSFSNLDLTVREMVAMGRSPHLGRLQWLTKSDQYQIDKALQVVDLESLSGRSLMTLSGGESQRVILARSLAQEPQVLLLDEPTSHLDFAHQVHFFEVLKELHNSGDMTIVCVSHDLNLCSNYVEQIALLQEGRFYRNGSPEEVLQQEVLESLYRTPIHVGLHPQTGRPQIFLNVRERDKQL